MFCSVISGAVYGVESYLVHVETDISSGLPCVDMVGSVGIKVREAKERVKVALRNTGYPLPPKRVTVNLSPADRKKDESAFDLPIAIGILTAMEVIKMADIENVLFLGEMGLSGEVKAVKGVLPIVRQAAASGIKTCILPEVNEREAEVIPGIKVVGVGSLQEAIHFLLHKKTAEKKYKEVQTEQKEKQTDFEEVRGQEFAKRAAMVAAGGFHHMLLVGPPGAGKTMIAKRIPGILPPMTYEESLEVSSLYSIGGMLKEGNALMKARPFISPHHTITERAMAGGGAIPKPGVISLAHRGILFLDEFAEFKRTVIDIMRQPLEEKVVRISRSRGTFSYPADFMMVAAMNPCPCGYYPDGFRCRCSEAEVRRYLNHISGPILDRIDICVQMGDIDTASIYKKKKGETSASMRGKVMRAREMQIKRYQGKKGYFNSALTESEVEKYCVLSEDLYRFLTDVLQRQKMSIRAYHRILKVARTIADLEQSEAIGEEHLLEALCYREAGEEYWR